MRRVCLLRAINVSGQRKMKMAELRGLCEGLGYRGVETYLQSGNLLLEAPEGEKALGERISSAIRGEFGHADVQVLVWTAEQLHAIRDANPLVGPEVDPTTLHFTFLAEPLSAASPIDPARYLPDAFAVGEQVVYVRVENGYGRTKLNNGFFERKLGVPATTRNWRTVNRLCEWVVG